MTWCALATPGAGPVDRLPPGPMSVGTLLLEAPVSLAMAPLVLLNVTDAQGARWRVAVTRDGDVHVDLPQVQARLALRLDDWPQPVRVSLSWDAHSGAVLLSAFQPQDGHLDQHLAFDPHMPDGAHLSELLHGWVSAPPGPGSFVAMSQAFEPVGPMPGLSQGMVMWSRHGLIQSQDVHVGDQVQGVDGALTAIETLVTHHLPGAGSLAPVRLSAPWNGLTQDLVVSAETQLMLIGDDVEYLCGTEAALVRAGQLVDGRTVRWDHAGPFVTYHHPLCAKAPILGGAFPFACLDFGPVRDSDLAQASSLLATCAAAPPGPEPTDLPRLKDYEAVTLASMRAA